MKGSVSASTLQLPRAGGRVDAERLLTGRRSIHSKKSLAQLKSKRGKLSGANSISPDFQKLRAAASQSLIRNEIDRRQAGGTGGLSTTRKLSKANTGLFENNRQPIQGRVRPKSAMALGASRHNLRALRSPSSRGYQSSREELRQQKLRESRRKLAAVLTLKLQGKYGAQNSFNKQEIAKLVATFVGTSQSISEADLIELEKRVRHVLGVSSPPDSRPSTTMSHKTSKAKAEDLPGSAQDILRNVGVSNPDHVPAALTSEWNLLDLYNSASFETEQEAFHRKVQNDKLEQRRILTEQMEERKRAEQQEREDQKQYDDKQQRLFEKWKLDQKTLKAQQLGLMLDEKAVRHQQLMEKEQEKLRERQTALEREKLELSICEREMYEEVKMKHRAMLKERERMKRILHENELNEKRKKEELKQEAVEDIRLMNEYTEKLNREEQERREAFDRRIQRYKVLGELWENKGAGKAQREEELKLERKILSDAAKKEHQDVLREQREKSHRRNQLLMNLEENKKIIQQKQIRERFEKEEDDRYASNYRKEGEDYVKEQVQRERLRHETLLEQRRHLEAQIAEVQSRPKDEMSSTERQLNSQLLRRLQQDHSTMKKVQEKAYVGRTQMMHSTGITSTFGRMGIGSTSL